MSDSLIKLTINTPISSFSSKAGDMIVLPGEQGELGILKDHMGLVAELKSGKIKIYLQNEVIEEIEIINSIAYVKSSGVEIFAS